MPKPLPHAFRRRHDRPAVIGHRGVRGARPENTLAALAEAHRQGADAIEIDVRPCRTGEIVVFHDPDLRRIAHDPRSVADLSLLELRGIDAGAGEQIPTLVELLDAAKSLGLGVNIEIKHDTPDRPRTALAVARILARWPSSHDLVVSSFDPLVLQIHRAAVSRLCHALLVHESTYHDWALRLARVTHIDGVHTEHTITVPARVRWFTERTFVNTWTIDDPDEARRAFDLGVSAIITDVPQRLLAEFGREMDGGPPPAGLRSDPSSGG